MALDIAKYFFIAAIKVNYCQARCFLCLLLSHSVSPAVQFGRPHRRPIAEEEICFLRIIRFWFPTGSVVLALAPTLPPGGLVESKRVSAAAQISLCWAGSLVLPRLFFFLCLCSPLYVSLCSLSRTSTMVTAGCVCGHSTKRDRNRRRPQSHTWLFSTILMCLLTVANADPRQDGRSLQAMNPWPWITLTHGKE